MKNDILRSQPLFAGLPDSEIQNLTETLLVRCHQVGDILMEEDGTSDHLLILQDGEVEIIEISGDH